MTERQTRDSIWVKAPSHTADALNEAIKAVMSFFSEKRSEVFKTITVDNGSEFANLPHPQFITPRAVIRDRHVQLFSRMGRNGGGFVGVISGMIAAPVRTFQHGFRYHGGGKNSGLPDAVTGQLVLT